MFFKIEEQLFNGSNFQYFTYENDILDLNFNGKINTKIQQNQDDFENFLSIISSNENFLLLKKEFGINLKNISGISKDSTNTILYFIDGSNTIIDIEFSHIENKILGD